MTGADLAIVIPLWRRTNHIQRVYESARAATPGARIVFMASDGDINVQVELNQHRSDDRLAPYFHDRRVQVGIIDGPGGEMGDYAIKINVGYRVTTEPFIFTGADDLDFHPGWYDAARALIRDEPCQYIDTRMEHVRYVGRTDADRATSWPGVVGTVDLCNGRTTDGTHSTHSLVARWYADCCAVIDKPGAIYAECYPHEFVDDELCQSAMARGAYAHAHDAIVEHLHPNVGKAPLDPTYMRGRAWTQLSRRRFRQRRKLWT